MIYPLEIRKKALDHYKENNCKNLTAEVFGITKQTLYNWLKREKLGNLEAKKRKTGSYKIDEEELICYIKQHPDALLSDVAKVFNVENSTIFFILKKLGISLNKKYSSKRNRS